MRIHSKRKTRADVSEYHYVSFLCGNYGRSGKVACTTHFIGEEILHDIVLTQIREHARMVECDEAGVVESILRLHTSESEASRTAFAYELKSHKSRLVTLEKLIEKLYEDRLAGTIPETVFRNLTRRSSRSPASLYPPRE